jgi:phage I-like protein
MSENEKGFGSKLKGLFFESDEKPADENKSPADLVAELAAQSGARPAAAPPPEPPPPNLNTQKMATAAGAPTDFDAIFKDAGMDAAELDRVKKAEELLKGLPESTPQEVKRQIVEASLKAFGFELEKIVAAANNQKRALDTYVRVNEQVTAKAITEAEGQIKGLHEKIAALKLDIEKRTRHLASLSEAATNRKTQVQKVIEFFERPGGAPVAPKP